MNSGMYSATAGMMASLDRLDVIANNIANLNSTAFKSDIPFEQVLRFLSEGPFPGKDQPILAGSRIDLNPGTIRVTGRNLDLAFEGDGFFVVQATNGETLLTRNGSLQWNSKRELVAANGYPVMDKFNKKIQLYGEQISFTPQGEVFIDGNYATTIKLVAAPAADSLEKLGSNYYRIKGGGAPTALLNPRLVPGALEQANVNLMTELASMIVTQRAFEFQNRAVDTILVQILRRTVSELPRPV